MPSRSPFARSNPAAVAVLALVLALGALTSRPPVPADPAAEAEATLDAAHDDAGLDVAADTPVVGVRLAAGDVGVAAADEPAGAGWAAGDDPHPVQFLEIHVDGEPVGLAFRDVSPRLVNGRTAVLLRDGDGEPWAPTAQALSDAGFRVIVPHLVGHGRPGQPAPALGSDALANHVAILLDSLGAASAALVGEGTATTVAVRLATRWPRAQRLVVAAGGEDGVLPSPEALAELAAGLAGVAVPTLVVAEGAGDAGAGQLLRETAAGGSVRFVSLPGPRASRAAPGGFHEVLLGFLGH